MVECVGEGEQAVQVSPCYIACNFKTVFILEKNHPCLLALFGRYIWMEIFSDPMIHFK